MRRANLAQLNCDLWGVERRHYNSMQTGTYGTHSVA